MSLAYQIRGMTGAAPEVHLNGTIGTGDTSFAFAPGEGTGWPTTNIPAIIDYDNGFAEKVFIGTRSGVNCTSVLRGEDNTTAKSHSSGAKIRHVGFAQDFIESNAVAAALTTKGDSLWKGGTLSVAPARLAAGTDQQVIRYKAANALGVETTWLGSIPVFASTAARDAAITAPSAGQACYVDTGATTEGLYFYNGTSWRVSSWAEPWGLISKVTSTSSAQTAISTVADITGLTSTFTAVAGRDYRVQVNIVAQSTVATDAFVATVTDGAGTALDSFQFNLGTTAFSQKFCFSTHLTASGSTTWKARVARSAGTGTLTLASTSATNFMLWTIHDDGPTGNPA